MVRPATGLARGGVALSLASHNVRGLNPAKLLAFLDTWQRDGQDIVLLQETHLTVFTMAALVPHLVGWAAYWAHGTQRSAGVAVLIRARLLSAGGGPLSVADVHPAHDGRSLHLRLGWAGHQAGMRLASVYLPNEASHQRAFVADRLQPLAAAAQASQEDLFLGGDFNFVPDVCLDRLPACMPMTAPLHPDTRTQQLFREALPGMVDVWRHSHPSTRLFTRFGHSSAARLDRFHVSTGLAAFVGPRPASASRGHLSDHRLLAVTLRPKAASPEAPQEQRRRARMGFTADPALHAQFMAAAAALAAAAPLHPAELVHWWGGFKCDIFHLCQQLHRAQRARHHHRREGAAEDLAEAYLRAESGAAGAIADVLAARTRVSAAEAADRAASRMAAPRVLHASGRTSLPVCMPGLRMVPRPTTPDSSSCGTR